MLCEARTSSFTQLEGLIIWWEDVMTEHWEGSSDYVLSIKIILLSTSASAATRFSGLFSKRRLSSICLSINCPNTSTNTHAILGTNRSINRLNGSKSCLLAEVLVGKEISRKNELNNIRKLLMQETNIDNMESLWRWWIPSKQWKECSQKCRWS